MELFAFKGEYLREAERNIGKFPPERKQSAVLSLLFLAQEQDRAGGAFVSESAMRTIALMLEMPFIRVVEVATFFTMVQLEPIGRIHVQLCGTTPCMLRGAEDLKAAIESRYGIGEMETDSEGMVTLTEVECLGACCNAPMVQINDDYYEDLTAIRLIEIIEDLRNGGTPLVGSQTGRVSSEPEGMKPS